ncbi:MAG: hypothetical protein ACI8ZN_000956 [Bacteroidia bacterium]|jgi:hypothetical protein
MMAFAENPDDLKRDLTNMDENTRTVATGLGLYFNRSYSPWSKSQNRYKTNRALRVGIGLHSAKESMVVYHNREMDTSIVFCNKNSEVTFELAYLIKGTWGQQKKWHWHYGISSNASVTFSNEMFVMEGKYFGVDQHPSTQERLDENTATYLAKPLVYNRLYFTYNIHRQLGDHVSLGFDARRGAGFQTIIGGKSNYIVKTGSFVIGIKYNLAPFN